MVTPRRVWHEFKDDNEKLEYLKSKNLIPKTKGLRTIYYTGMYVDQIVECDVVGYVDETTLVISISGELHCIHPEYLCEMQSQPITRAYKKTHSSKQNAETDEQLRINA